MSEYSTGKPNKNHNSNRSLMWQDVLSAMVYLYQYRVWSSTESIRAAPPAEGYIHIFGAIYSI